MAKIWDDRKKALDQLKESLAVVKARVDDIEKDLGTAAENIPYRLAGYVESLTRYNKNIQDLWPVIYDASEAEEARVAESPKIKLPSGMALIDGVPYKTGADITLPASQNPVWDNEAAVQWTTTTQESPGAFEPGKEVNLDWFSNLATKLQYYIAQDTADYKAVWDLIRVGFGAITGTNMWLRGEVKVKPIPSLPEAQPGPNPTPPNLIKGQKGDPLTTPLKIVIHEQTFTYGFGEVYLRIYRMGYILILEITMFANSTVASLPIAEEVIGTTLVDDESIYLVNNSRIPLLHKNYDRFDFGLVDLLLTADANKQLTLSLTGVGLVEAELACNATYTIPVITNVDASFYSGGTNLSWEIMALKINNFRQYIVQYNGGEAPVPPPSPMGIGMDNIADTVFEEIKARKFILSKDDPHGPSSYTGTPLDYEGIKDHILDVVYVDQMVLEAGDPHAPEKASEDPLVYETLSTAVLPVLRACKFTLVEASNKVAVDEFTTDYYFYYEDKKKNFAPTADNSTAIPNSFLPSKPTAWALHGNDSKGSVDSLLHIGDDEGAIDAYGFYCYGPEGKYQVSNYTLQRSVFTSVGNPVWYKEASRFLFTIYRENGTIVYTFSANYTKNGLDSWPTGTYDLIGFGEMPSNLQPLNHLVLQIGKSSYVVIQNTGVVKLITSNNESIVEGVDFTTVYAADPEDKRILETYTEALVSSTHTRYDERINKEPMSDYIVGAEQEYKWPSVNMKMLQLNQNNGDCWAFNYQLHNLRCPMYAADGTVVDDAAKIEALASDKGNRVVMGDGGVLRLINMQKQDVKGFNSDMPTGEYILYFQVVKFDWAHPKISYLQKMVKANQDELQNIITNFDDVSKTGYFDRINAYARSTVLMLQTSVTLLSEVQESLYGYSNVKSTKDTERMPIRTLLSNYYS